MQWYGSQTLEYHYRSKLPVSDGQECPISNELLNIPSAWAPIEWNISSDLVKIENDNSKKKSADEITDGSIHTTKNELIENLTDSIFRRLGFKALTDGRNKDLLSVIVGAVDALFTGLCSDAKNFQDESPHLDEYFCVRKMVALRKIDVNLAT